MEDAMSNQSENAYYVNGYICFTCGAFVKYGDVHTCPGTTYSLPYPPFPAAPESLKDYIAKRLDEIDRRLDTLVKVFHLMERLEELYNRIEEKEKDGN
jgi:hypothetical protein